MYDILRRKLLGNILSFYRTYYFDIELLDHFSLLSCYDSSQNSIFFIGSMVMYRENWNKLNCYAIKRPMVFIEKLCPLLFFFVKTQVSYSNFICEYFINYFALYMDFEIVYFNGWIYFFLSLDILDT